MVHHGRATRSRAKVVKLAKRGTSVATRRSHNGKKQRQSWTKPIGLLLKLHDSRNCTKHNCRCDYMDMPAASDEPSQGSRPAELEMTSEIEREIDFWRMTGNPPFPELRLTTPEYWLRFSTVDLRLVHHIAGLSIDMHKRGYAACTVWAQKMPV